MYLQRPVKAVLRRQLPTAPSTASALHTQRRHKAGEQSVSDEAKEITGRGLWGDELLPAGYPHTAFWGKLRIPPFDYTRRRREKSTVIGIDLGTTNSCVSYLDPDSRMPIVVPIEGKKTTPTVVGINDRRERKFGHVAYADAAESGLVLCSGKRLLGKRLADRSLPREVYADVIELTQSKHDGVAIRITQTLDQMGTHAALDNDLGKRKEVTIEYPVVHVIGMFLRYLKSHAEDELNMNCDAACITVPAHFNVAQRRATEDAAIIAGMDVLEILDEPSAAALAYRELVANTSFHHKGTARVLVFDLGGGTFDVAVLQMNFDDGVSAILANGGDDTLGGDDFDQCIVKHWKLQLERINFEDDEALNLDAQLLREAAAAKIVLDTSEEFVCYVHVHIDRLRMRRVPLKLTRFEYEEMTAPLLERMKVCCDQVFHDSNVTAKDIDDVLLVGEMTRTPHILEYIEKTFGKRPVFSDVCSPGTVVSSGAILRAKQVLDIRDGKDVANFVYDKRSVQYRKGLSFTKGLMYDVQEGWEGWKRRRKESPGDTRDRLSLENGLNENRIEALSKEIVITEIEMSKQAMLKKVQDEAEELLSSIGTWKEPRLGFSDASIDELLEVTRFWNRNCTVNRTGEEQLAQAMWELRFYFEELAGTTVETALEQMKSDPETMRILAETEPEQSSAVRTFTKKSSNSESKEEKAVVEDNVVETMEKGEGEESEAVKVAAPVRKFTKGKKE